MKKIILLLTLINLAFQPAYAWNFSSVSNFFNSDEKQIKRLLKSQISYANKENYPKFINTFADNYKSGDGFNLDTYSKLIKDIWSTYDNIKYNIDIKDISVSKDKATVNLTEIATGKIGYSDVYKGELKSESETVCYLEKQGNQWKVVSDFIKEESTSMLYGSAKNLDIRLNAPKEIKPNTEYTATLEFTPPEETIAIASIASDKVEYPQQQTKEVFRTLPDDNILERMFTSNNENLNEYIVASIGLTKTSVSDANISLNLTGFGYAITRVNVISQQEKQKETTNE